MSQYPNYYNAPPPNPRPTSVTVLAIVGIVWGALMLLCNGVGLIPELIPNFGGADPVFAELRANSVARAWGVVGPVIGLGLAVLLLAGSIGALMLRGWGRAAMMVFAVAEILAGLVNLVITIGVINPITAKAAPAGPGAQGNAFAIGQHFGTAVAVAVALVLPVWILIVMKRPAVIAAFAGTGEGGAASGFPMYSGAAGGGPAYPPGQPGKYDPSQYPQYPPQGPYGQ